jgi:tetratricopeptide (TPR) repeat protein
MKRILTFLFLLLFSTKVALGQGLTVEAPSVVAMDETFRLVFTSDGKMSDFNWPGSDDFNVVWGPQKGTSSSVSIINGKRTSTHKETVTYLLQAKGEGRFTIPVATAIIDKQQYSTRSVTIEVVGSQQERQTQDQQADTQQSQSDSKVQSASSDDIFLRLTLNKRNVVKGEPIIATLKLYTRVDIASFEDVKFPTFNGFWSREIDTPQNITFNRENVDGTIYNAALLRRYMLIPQQTGNIKIESAEMICVVRVRASTTGPRSIFDDFFDNFQTVRKRLFTPETTVTVKALPSAPASFGGGVGDFKISASLSKDSLTAHEAASLTITINGTGNISMLEAPKVEFPSDFELYDVKTTEKVSYDGTSGSKTFEFPFIPRSHGDFEIAPIEYSFYDLSSKQYRTLNTGVLPVKVGRGSGIEDGGVVMPGVTRQSVKNLAEDIRYIATGTPSLRDKGRFFAGSLYFYGLIALFILLFFAVGAILKKRAALRTDVVGTRNRRAKKMARARLRQADTYLKQGLSGAYYEELHKAMLGYVSDKLTIPVADLSKERISSSLTEKSVPEQLITRFISILDRCEFARYAPDSETAEMESLYNEAVSVLSEIESKLKIATKRPGSSATLIIAALLCISPLVTSAQESVDDLWKMAADYYAEEDYINALNFYLMIEGEQKVSPDLYYNIANSYFKSGDNSHAILYYEKALKLDPSHDDAAHNLAIAQRFTLDKIDVLPDLILVTWVRNVKYLFPADVWAWISVVLAFAVFMLMLGFRFGSSLRGRKASFVLACVGLLFAIIAFTFSISEKNDAIKEDSAIVMSPVASVRSSPGEAGKSIFVLHEGTKVSLLDELGDWTRIELSDGRQGWIAAESISKI